MRQKTTRKFIELVSADDEVAADTIGDTGGSSGSNTICESPVTMVGHLDATEEAWVEAIDDSGPMLPFDEILDEARKSFTNALTFENEPDDLFDGIDLRMDEEPVILSNKRSSSNLRMLYQLFAFNLVLCIVQATCGLIANSLALLGDGMLMSVDVITYVVNIYVERKKSISKRHKAKVDQLGAIMSLLLLSFTTVWLLIDSLHRLIYPIEGTVNGTIMFAFTVLNLLIDALLLRNFLKSGADSQSMNMKSALLHLGADIIRGFGVLISSCWIYFHPADGIAADAICSLFVSLFILVSTVNVGGKLFMKMYQKPRDLLDETALREIIGYEEDGIEEDKLGKDSMEVVVVPTVVVIPPENAEEKV